MMKRIRKYFISGLLVFLPLALTIYLLILAINFADGFLGKFLEPYFYKRFGFYLPGLGILLGIYLIIGIGFFVTHYLGRKIYDYVESVLVKFPFFRQVYPAMKEMASFLFERDKMTAFQKVVLFEYPRKGLYSLGFLTNDASSVFCSVTGKDLCNIFIPTSPSPLTGFLVLVPRNEIIMTDIAIEQAMKIIVSGGVINP